MKHPKLHHAFEVVAELPEPLRPLTDLAYNFHWTWHHETRELFRGIDKDEWEATNHNPVLLISGLSAERKDRLAADKAFLQRLSQCRAALQEYLARETWFGRSHAQPEGGMRVAYFCAEFGVSEALPIYSGGLGVLAGDHLKAASDLGLPLVGVGLLYARGYFRQRLDRDGRQQEVYPQYDPYQLPLRLMRNAGRQPVRVVVELPDRTVTCQVWRADVGRVPLYLLDSNVLENEPDDQSITDTLYGGDEEMRLRQEMILGFGGMRALRELGITPTVCHMNEGHAGFLTVERIRQTREQFNCDFDTARQIVAASNVFTTHTPVPAGFDVFHPAMLERYVQRELDALGIPFEEFLRLGRLDSENEGEAFNMAVLAMQNANYVNAVSQLHARVTRSMFGANWHDYPEDEVPIQGITNGIHTLTWVSKRFADLYDEHLGILWRSEPDNPQAWEAVGAIPDEDLWSAIENQRGDLIRLVRKRVHADIERKHLARAEFGVDTILDPRVLTIGFARRFATYKRATLLLSDRERLKKLLFHQERPIQIILAGKSHPRDEGGKGLIQELVQFINDEGGSSRMVFLEDYDMRIARAMVQGVDVWLNNPRRPMEASGTSGMKAVPNAVLNCSVLDGWWDEAYQPGLGFAIGDRDEPRDAARQDHSDSASLYSLLENEIVPRFYQRSDKGLPTAWLAMIKSSIRALAPRFSTCRMVTEYAERAYLPATKAYQRLTENNIEGAKAVMEFKRRVAAAWPQVRIESVAELNGTTHAVGGEFCVRAVVALGALTPAEVRVQALVGKTGPNRDLLDAQPVEMRHVKVEAGRHVYESTLRCEEPGYRGYTVRVVPSHAHIVAAHDLPLVRWEGE